MKKLLILGGGTAGWMAANMLNHYLGTKGSGSNNESSVAAHSSEKNQQNWQITLVESPQIGIIGVGEGSTPQLKNFFDLLKISESEWMPQCSASFKNGISFVNWSAQADAYNSSDNVEIITQASAQLSSKHRYFHPFPSPLDRQTAAAFLYHCQMRARGMDVPANPDNFFLAAELARRNLSPKAKLGKPQMPLNYAYHFDSAKLGKFLCQHAVKNGVEHISGLMKHSLKDQKGGIKAIELSSGEKLEADLFIDATGFNSLLLQGALEVPFESFGNNLFNNRAIAIPSKKQTIISSETKATALSNGWAWQIPLRNRTGNGYVYSDAYISPSQAEQELREHLGSHVADNVEARHLKMNVGQVKQHWYKNVVGVGLSQGFIEPLEATALHLVQETIQKLATTLLDSTFQENEEQLKAAFNEDIKKRFNGIRDYIVCHYKLNSRKDSQYWIDNRDNNNISAQLAEVIDTWRSKKDISPVLEKYQMTRYYPVISWYCLLAGYADFAPVTSPNKLPVSNMKQLTQYISKHTEYFETHNKALNIE